MWMTVVDAMTILTAIATSTFSGEQQVQRPLVQLQLGCHMVNHHLMRLILHPLVGAINKQSINYITHSMTMVTMAQYIPQLNVR
jgi:hypothetical protein